MCVFAYVIVCVLLSTLLLGRYVVLTNPCALNEQHPSFLGTEHRRGGPSQDVEDVAGSKRDPNWAPNRWSGVGASSS